MEKPKKKRSFPYHKLERLIMLAVKHNLQTLKVGEFEIVVRPPTPAMQQRSEDATTIKHNGKTLSPRQQEDYVLFGPNGITDE